MSMRSILPANMQYDDFINQGVLALIDCIDKFDPSRGASFDTYIFKRLRGSVLSYMRKQSLAAVSGALGTQDNSAGTGCADRRTEQRAYTG